MKINKTVKGLAVGTSLAAFVTLAVPTTGQAADLQHGQLESVADKKAEKKKEEKKDDKKAEKKDEKKGEGGEGSCGEGSCGEGSCGGKKEEPKK